MYSYFRRGYTSESHQVLETKASHARLFIFFLMAMKDQNVYHPAKYMNLGFRIGEPAKHVL